MVAHSVEEVLIPFAQDRGIPPPFDLGPIACRWGQVPDSLPAKKWHATSIVQCGRSLRTKTWIGEKIKNMLTSESWRWLWKFLRLATCQVMVHDVLPSMTIQAAVHACEAVSQGLSEALVCDKTRTALFHVSAAAESLFALEMVLLDLTDARRIGEASDGRVFEDAKYVFGVFGGVLPGPRRELNALSLAVDEALRRIVRGYRDVLKDVLRSSNFPSAYLPSLKKRLDFY